MVSPKRRRRRTKPRRNVSRAVRLLIRDIARRLPELSHVRADRILVVAGEARRASRATIRPLRFAHGRRLSPDGTRRRPRVSFCTRRILYVMTLRPLFFRMSTPEKRVETVIHELFHISQAFDGSLDPARRHSALKGPGFEHALRPLVKRYLAGCSDKALAWVGLNEEVLVRQWLEKPPASYSRESRVRRSYDETQTFLGPVRMITRHTRH
jgi:hypothetical protein